MADLNISASSGAESSSREMVELAINNALPNIDDLPERAEYDITQSQLESELDAIAASASEIRPVVRGQPSAVSVSESVAAMDAVSTSSTAMDAVSTSSTAMDAVSASQTARDAVNASQLAFDAVAAANMAIGKFVAGTAGLTPSNFADMDAVSTSSTAMDAVSTSSTAMDAVLRSTTATDAVWSTDLASEAIWKNAGSPSPPHDYDADFSSSLVSGYNGGRALSIVGSNPQNSGTRYWETTLDLTDVSQLSVATEKNTTAGGGDMEMTVKVGSNTVFTSNASDSDFGWTERTFDVSTQSGETTVQVGWNFTGSGYSGTFTANFDNLQVS